MSFELNEEYYEKYGLITNSEIFADWCYIGARGYDKEPELDAIIKQMKKG